MKNRSSKFFSFCLVALLFISCFGVLSKLAVGQEAKTYFKSFEADSTYLKIPEFNIADSSVSYATKKQGLEYQFNITLEKPLESNIVSLPIETKGLEFYYQPALDAELNANDYDFLNSTHAIIKDKIVEYRPENVVGSYAVYKSNIGSGETGKLYHIYTPLIVDAKGVSSWGKLDVSKTELTITIDEKFLESAVYPIVIDPTIGYTSIGGTTSTNSGVANKVLYVVASAGTMNTISLYVSCSTSGQIVHAGFYNGTILLSNLTQTINTFTGWLNFDVADFNFDNASTFGLGFKISGAITYYRDTTGTANQHQQDQGLAAGDGLPMVFQTDAQTNWQYSLFANYTETVVPVENISVVLNQPENDSTINMFSCNFNYTPSLFGVDSFSNASLVVNGSSVASNSSIIVNATVNTISYTFPVNGTYLWNVQVWNSTAGVLAGENFTLTVGVYEAPIATPSALSAEDVLGLGVVALGCAVLFPIVFLLIFRKKDVR